MSALPSLLRIEQMELFAPQPVAPPSVCPTADLRSARHRPEGDVYDLQHFFEVINQTAFKNALAPCTLRWSRNRWKITLGICDVKRRTVTLNCCLDDARVPEMVVASVIHHEMLHLFFGIAEGPNGTQRYHTPQFRTAEKIFPGHAESEKWIADNWPLRGRPAKRQRPSDNSFLSYLSLMCP
jgi:hypothetical protein